MKPPASFDVLNIRKTISHITYLLFSVIVTLLWIIIGKITTIPDAAGLFIMLFVQLEFFIYLGDRLFANLNFDRSPVEITRIIALRFLIFLAGCLIASMIFFIIVHTAIMWSMGESPAEVIAHFFTAEINTWFKATASGLSLGAIIFIFLLWQTSLRREQKLREEKLVFQNETLKNQVNPHFLFNCLNTISSLVRTQPETAEIFINNLSSVYRYILENGHKDKVELESELNFINEYFSLHRIRDDGKILMDIEVTDYYRYQILPVSLQILIENAIKHNVSTRENPLRISIYIEDQLIVVKNNLQKKATQLKSTEIGLKNLAERVRLVTGRTLIIEDTENEFIVKIPLLI